MGKIKRRRATLKKPAEDEAGIGAAAAEAAAAEAEETPAAEGAAAEGEATDDGGKAKSLAFAAGGKRTKGKIHSMKSRLKNAANRTAESVAVDEKEDKAQRELHLSANFVVWKQLIWPVHRQTP